MEANIELFINYCVRFCDRQLITQYKQVIFVDAHHGELPNGFSFYECKAAPAENFTTHTLAPENVMWIAQELFGYTPKCKVMAISGSYWELRNGMTEEASANLTNSLKFFKNQYSTVGQKMQTLTKDYTFT